MKSLTWGSWALVRAGRGSDGQDAAVDPNALARATVRHTIRDHPGMTGNSLAVFLRIKASGHLASIWPLIRAGEVDRAIAVVRLAAEYYRQAGEVDTPRVLP